MSTTRTVSLAIPAGAQVGYARTVSTTTASTINTSIPADATIPQISEGVAYPSLDTTYTPKYTNSLLEVEVVIPYTSNSAAGALTFALFRDSTADAIVATSVSIAGGTVHPLVLRCIVPASALVATTIKLRWCTQTGTGYLINYAGTQYFGVSNMATMTIKEIRQ